MPTLIEKTKELDTKRGALAARFAEFKDEKGAWKEITPAVQTEFIDRNNELKSLSDEVASLKAVEEACNENNDAIKALRAPQRGFGFDGGDGNAVPVPVKSMGELFVESEEFKTRENRGKSAYAVRLPGAPTEILRNTAAKSLMTTSAGLAPYPPRLTEIVPYPVRQPVVAALIPITETDAPAIIYLEITTWTNNAAAVAEGAQKPESAVVGTQRTIPMTKIATTLPVTEEQMSYIPGIKEFIDNTLGTMVNLAEDTELLNGNGTPDFTGFMNKSGVNTQAKGSDDVFTAALKNLTLIRTVGFANPTGWVMNPTDWQTYATQKDSTGRFILGAPGAQTDMRLWGIPVVSTVGQTQGSALAGDFQTWSHLWRNMDLRIDVGYVNAQFLTNEMTIRAEMREALQITRPSAFGVLSGL